MPLHQSTAPDAQDVFDTDGLQPGWWQSADGQWHAPVTDRYCGNGHPMHGEQAFCGACAAPRAEVAIESTSSFDPAAMCTAANATTSIQPTAVPAPKRSVRRLLRRR
jgi:hypothetical protein